MVLTSLDLKIKYQDYKDINGKIKREIENGKLFPIIKGLYETKSNTPGHYLGQYIYGPSYLSFDFALSWHGLIPERVVNYTLATFNKRRKKKYDTPFGLYLYRDVPKEAFQLSVNTVEVDGYTYLIASPEKALCDKLYTIRSVGSIKRLKNLLFEDLRIDEQEFDKLNREVLLNLASFYKNRNLILLKKMIEGEFIWQY